MEVSRPQLFVGERKVVRRSPQLQTCLADIASSPAAGATSRGKVYSSFQAAGVCSHVDPKNLPFFRAVIIGMEMSAGLQGGELPGLQGSRSDQGWSRSDQGLSKSDQERRGSDEGR